MSAVVNSAGTTRQLDKPAEPNEQITEEQVQDARRLSRIAMTLLREVSSLRRRWAPRFIDHEDRAVDATGATKYRFPHGFKGRVRWWAVDWTGSTGGSRLVRHADTDDNTLVVVSYTSGTVSLRIEETG